MQIKEELMIKLVTLEREVPKSRRKYYHFRSIYNFLFHIHNLNDVYEQDLVIKNINEFILSVEKEKIDNIQDSLAAFNKFIKPIGEIYERKLDFFVMIKPWILTIWIVFTFLLVYLLKNTLLLILYFLFLSALCFYLGNKYSRRKLYAFMW